MRYIRNKRRILFPDLWGGEKMRFKSREHAAQQLIEKLRPIYLHQNPLVLGIPRGAVSMARIIADALGGELDIVLVRKLRHPDQPEFAIGAIDETGHAFLAEWAADVDPQVIEAEKQRQLKVLRERRARYTAMREPIDAYDRIAIVVDDGIATGSTMTAALRALRGRGARKLIGAVAVASPDAVRAVLQECDSMVCLKISANFFAVGQFFEDFSQVSDLDVIAALRRSDAKASATG
jgi:putative phosphoribosyl transferase